MGFFYAKVGKSREDLIQPATPLDKQASRPASLFGAKVGGRLATTLIDSGQVGASQTMESPPACPLCRAPLQWMAGLLACTGTCAGRWMEDGGGRMVDVASLAYGACTCCEPRQMLVAAELGAICPHSHIEYLLLPQGALQKSAAAPHGTCHCCLPVRPLRIEGDSLVCSSKPSVQYETRDGRQVWKGNRATEDAEQILQQIDAALENNSAVVGLYGLFETG